MIGVEFRVGNEETGADQKRVIKTCNSERLKNLWSTTAISTVEFSDFEVKAFEEKNPDVKIKKKMKVIAIEALADLSTVVKVYVEP